MTYAQRMWGGVSALDPLVLQSLLGWGVPVGLANHGLWFATREHCCGCYWDARK